MPDYQSEHNTPWTPGLAGVERILKTDPRGRTDAVLYESFYLTNLSHRQLPPDSFVKVGSDAHVIP